MLSNFFSSGEIEKSNSGANFFCSSNDAAEEGEGKISRPNENNPKELCRWVMFKWFKFCSAAI